MKMGSMIIGAALVPGIEAPKVDVMSGSSSRKRKLFQQKRPEKDSSMSLKYWNIINKPIKLM